MMHELTLTKPSVLVPDMKIVICANVYTPFAHMASIKLLLESCAIEGIDSVIWAGGLLWKGDGVGQLGEIMRDIFKIVKHQYWLKEERQPNDKIAHKAGLGDFVESGQLILCGLDVEAFNRRWRISRELTSEGGKAERLARYYQQNIIAGSERWATTSIDGYLAIDTGSLSEVPGVESSLQFWSIINGTPKAYKAYIR